MPPGGPGQGAFETKIRVAVQEQEQEDEDEEEDEEEEEQEAVEENEAVKELAITKASQSFSVVFVFDATGSMGAYLAALKSQIVQMANDFSRQMRHFKFEFACVAYRDVKDTPRFQTHAFSKDVGAFESFMGGVSASGGGDECEDVLGGLNIAASMKFRHSNKLCVLCADAPCHGRRYYTQVGGNAENTLSFKALCSAQFSEFGAQLWKCAGSESCANRVQRRSSDSPN